MNISMALKNKHFRDTVLINIIVFLIYELFLYLLFFEWSKSSLNFKLVSFTWMGVILIFAIIFCALGLGNKNKNSLVFGLELIGMALFSVYSYLSLTAFPVINIYKSLSIYAVLPSAIVFIYYIAKISIMFKNKIKR